MASKKVDVATALQGLDLSGTNEKMAAETKDSKSNKKELELKKKPAKQVNNTSLYLDNELKNYVKLMASVKGITTAEYIVQLIQKDFESNKAFYKQAKKISEQN